MGYGKTKTRKKANTRSLSSQLKKKKSPVKRVGKWKIKNKK